MPVLSDVKRPRARAPWARLRRVSLRQLLPDAFLLSVSLFGGLWLRLGLPEALRELPILLKHWPIFLGARLSVFALDGVYDIVWRHFSVRDTLRLIRAFGISLVVILALSLVVDVGRMPRAVFFIDAMLGILLLCGARLLRRLLFERRMGRDARREGKRTLIFGAGITGRLLAARLATDEAAHAHVVGFVDDDPQKAGRYVAGIRVVGRREELEDVMASQQVEQVLVAMKHPPGEALREVVQCCRNAGVPVRIVAGLASAANAPTAVRPVTLSDLLNRAPRQLPLEPLREMLRGKRVLVTGAGGSIGSELARQVMGFGPAALLLLDHSEFALFEIDTELRAAASEGTVVVPILADVRDAGRLRPVFTQYRPEVVLHAAAYKHVHLVEANPHSAVLNNVGGTLNVLEESERVGVDRFVLISTDKAVNPGGVMGATKRLCELLVSAHGAATGLPYCAVRFGNVLGSSGSLVPTLTRQIEAGQPLTITHPEMERYFMLIPEAVALVLRASTLVEPGAIAILRMGDPIRIVDIARSLIALTGRTESEVPIVFTGIRPGEKLREELYLRGDEVVTEDPDVLVLPKADAEPLERETLLEATRRLLRLAESSAPETLDALASLTGLKRAPWPRSDASTMAYAEARPEAPPALH